MTETSQTVPVHRSRSHSRKSFSGRNIHRGNLQPVFYFSGAIVMLIIAKLLHTDVLALVPGALGLIILSVSKNLKWRPGVFISMVCILLMIMLFVWQWTDRYFIAAISGKFYSKPLIFLRGITDSLILAGLVWIFQQLLNTFHVRSGQKWSGKSLSMKFFRLLFYFLLFFLFFWIFAFVMDKSQPLTSLGDQDSAMIAGAIALLASGIPAIIYISKGSPYEKKRSYHGHRHRYNRNDQPKNTNVD